MGQPLNGPSNYDAVAQFGKIWGSNDPLGAKLSRTWEWANYTVPDAQQRIAQMQPQLSPGAATLNNMLGSPMAAISGGMAYMLGGSDTDAYYASQLGAGLDGVAASVAGFQIPRAPQPGQTAAASRIRNVREGSTESVGTGKAGEFSIVDWSGYPAGVPKPQGPFRLVEGAEYEAARNAANAANNAIRRDQGLVGKPVDVHEIQPVKFGGSPTEQANKVVLPRDVHRQEVTPWWNRLQRDVNTQ